MPFVLIDKPVPDVTRITLNRPERMNAMAFDVMIPLREALEEISYDNGTRVVVLTGAGSGFCSGADLEDAGPLPNIAGLTRSSIARRAMELLDDVITALRKMHQPVIGAINGPAIGGGFCLAVATDIRIASETAYFRAAGINNGLTSSELGISYLLPRGSARRARSRSCCRAATSTPPKPSGSGSCRAPSRPTSCSTRVTSSRAGSRR